MGIIKRRRTHGYAIFSSEMRKKMGDGIPLSETTRVIAEKWRNADGPTRQNYESRAAKGIIIEKTIRFSLIVKMHFSNYLS